MEIINKKIEVLKPYDKNPRKNEQAVKYVDTFPMTKAYDIADAVNDAERQQKCRVIDHRQGDRTVHDNLLCKYFS